MWRLPGQQFDFRLTDITARENSILPTVEFTFERSSKPIDTQSPQDNLITYATLEVSLKEDADSYSVNVIGEAKSRTLQQEWKSNDYTHMTFALNLGNYSLSRIEKIRNGSDLYLSFNLRFQAYIVRQPATMTEYTLHIDERIAKSKWVEDILPKLNYKNVALIELPQLEYPGLNKAIDTLNRAWKSYSRGDMDDVLVKCRMVLEEILTQVKKAGFEKKSVDKDGKPTGKGMVVDWEQFLGSENKGDIVGTILQKTYGFTGSGSHIGSIRDVNHAYFIILQTFSLIHLVISRFNLMKDGNKK